MTSFFSDACFSARGRTDLFVILNGWGGALLSLFCVCAVANGYAFVRLRRMSDTEKAVGWRQHGLFTGLAVLGSFFGAVAFGVRLRHLTLLYNVNQMAAARSSDIFFLQMMYEQYVLRLRWAAAYYVLYPLELVFTVLAKLTVLNRMQRFTSSNVSSRRRWSFYNRISIGIVVLCCAAGFICNCISAFYYVRASDFMGDAAAAYAGNRSSSGHAFNLRARQEDAVADRFASAQRFSELCVSLLVTLSFMAVGVTSSRVISAALRQLFRAVSLLGSATQKRSAELREKVLEAGSEKGRQLQRKVIFTVVFIFVTVLVRGVVSLAYAVGQALQDNSNPCSSSNCDSCRNVYSNMQGWILYTPEFQLIGVLVASPLALLAALWGMSEVQVIEAMTAGHDRTHHAAYVTNPSSSTQRI